MVVDTVMEILPMIEKNRSLEERLDAYPELKVRVEKALAVAESGLRSADEVEEELVGITQGLGRQIMLEWATRNAEDASREHRTSADRGVSKGKKNSTGRPPTGR